MSLALSWQGPLPHPDDFKTYPEHVQEAILKLHVDKHNKRTERQDKALYAAMSLEEKRSDREDRLADVEIVVVRSVQRMATCISLSIVFSAIALALIGYDGVSIALIGALAAINAATLFVPLRRKSQAKDESPGD